MRLKLNDTVKIFKNIEDFYHNKPLLLLKYDFPISKTVEMRWHDEKLAGIIFSSFLFCLVIIFH